MYIWDGEGENVILSSLLDQSLLDKFKVLCGSQLVDDTYDPSINLVVSLVKETQAKPMGYGVIKDYNPEAIHKETP